MPTARWPSIARSFISSLEWTPSRIIEWAGKAEPFTTRLVEAMLAEKLHPEMGYRSALGVISLSRKHGAEQVEAACTRAVRTSTTGTPAGWIGP